MDQNTNSAYLETEVMTATPQRLRLMLIEAAIRYATQAMEHWRKQRDLQAISSLFRCRQVIVELLASVKPEMSNVAAQVADIYVFLLRTVAAAIHDKDEKKVMELVDVLRVERETWAEVCHQLPKPVSGNSLLGVTEVTSTNDFAPPANGSTSVSNLAGPDKSNSFSLDA